MVYPNLQFTEQDLELFSAASGDRSRLHLSEAYAARTSYGQRVVFGALGAVACLGCLDPPKSARAGSITAQFLRPMFLGVDYTFRSYERDGVIRVEMLDGSVPVVALTARFIPAESPTENGAETGPLFERAESRLVEESEITAGLRVTGRYNCDWRALKVLCRGWKGTESATAGALLWSSYLIGMELPGERALFSKVRIDFSAQMERGPIEYTTTVRRFNKWKQLEMEFALRGRDRTVACGQCVAFLRPAAPEVDIRRLKELSPPGVALRGRIALVIGGSRGLGAAITASLITQGARVLVTSRSVDENMPLEESFSGAICRERGDAADLEWLKRLRERIIAEYSRLDFLVCNAFPALQPLHLEANAARRVEDYIRHAVPLVAVPLCVFLDLLNQSAGCAVVISSEVVEKPVREWPHYIAAKHAIEGLAEAAALQYPGTGVLIVRPPKLLTEMVNTPMGRSNALPVEQMAVRIIERLSGRPTGVEVLHYQTVGNSGGVISSC